jgi:hypothetical protein
MMRRQRTEPPVLWQCFCRDWLGLSRRSTERWWAVLHRSRWSHAIELRSAVQCQTVFAKRWEQVDYLYQEIMAPATLVTGLEHLIKEEVLSRREAAVIEETILQRTGTTGQWKGA